MSSNQRNALVGTAALVIVGVAAYMFFNAGRATSGLPGTFTIQGACLACKKDVTATAELKQNQPLKCPLCGQEAVYNWMFCLECNKRFVPRLEKRAEGPPRLPIVPTCTACGSSRCEAYEADYPDHKPVADAPLPKWPM